MDLWIRSQNEEKLIKVNNICLGYAEKLNMYYLGVFYDDLQILGKYKTKERALEILDDIQDFINVEINIQGVSPEIADLYIKGAILESTQKIYEMPEE